MKVKVIKDFIPAESENAVLKGTIIEVSDEFAAELIESKHVETHVIDKSVEVVPEVEVEIKNVILEDKMDIQVGEKLVSPEQKLIGSLKFAKSLATGKWDAETKANGQNETTAADGGVLVSNEIVSGIYANAINTSFILGKCQSKPIGQNYNGMEVRQLNESNGTPADYNGVTLAVTAEGVAIVPQKLAYAKKTYAVNKLTAMVPFTSELLEDVPGIVAFTEQIVGRAYGLKIDQEILYGTSSLLTASVGNAGSRAVTLADASAPTLAELTEMYMAQINQGQAEWFMSGAVYSNIMGLESTLGQPVIQPLYTVAPYGTLFGRPINIVPCMRGANGNAGTISFSDFGNGYIIGTKGGVKMANSIHLYFNTDEEVYRWVLRIAGGPTKAVTMTLADGRVVSPLVMGHDS